MDRWGIQVRGAKAVPVRAEGVMDRRSTRRVFSLWVARIIALTGLTSWRFIRPTSGQETGESSALAELDRGTPTAPEQSLADQTATEPEIEEPSAAEPTAEPPTWQPLDDDFEGGNLAHWPAVDGLVVQQEVVLDGAFAARAWSDGLLPAAAAIGFPLPQAELWTRVRFQIVTPSTDQVELLWLSDATGNQVITVVISADETLGMLARNQPVPSATTLAAGAWYELIVHAAVSTGQVDVWLNGEGQLALSQSWDLGVAPLASLQLPAGSRSTSPSTASTSTSFRSIRILDSYR